MAARKHFFMPLLPFVKQHGIVDEREESAAGQGARTIQSKVYGGPGRPIEVGPDGAPKMPIRKLLDVHDPEEQQRELDDIAAIQAQHRMWRESAIRHNRARLRMGTILTGRHD